MKALPCPPDCKFNWEQFRKDIDIAMGHMITDVAISKEPPQNYMPTSIPLTKLLEYVIQQVDIEKERKK